MPNPGRFGWRAGSVRRTAHVASCVGRSVAALYGRVGPSAAARIVVVAWNAIAAQSAHRDESLAAQQLDADRAGQHDVIVSRDKTQPLADQQLSSTTAAAL